MVALPVLPIYLLGKNYKLSNKIIATIIAIYVLFPATIGGIFYDIHENCFLTFMLLMFIWAVEKKKNIPAVIFGLLTLAVKEDAVMYVGILGLFWICSRKDKIRGLICVITSGIYFVIAIAIVNSYGFGIMDFRYSNLFYDQKGGLIQIARVLITNPGYMISQIISNDNAQNMDKIGYIIVMFVPVAALLFQTGKKYSRYLLLGTLVLLCLLTTYPYQHSIDFQYNFGHIALMLYIIIMNVKDMKYSKKKWLLASSLIISAIMFVGLILPKPLQYTSKASSEKETIKVLDKACAMVPNDKSVITTGWLMPHLSKNLKVYDVEYLEDGKGKEKAAPKYPDYLLIDEREQDVQSQFADYVNSGKYELILSEKNPSTNEKIVSVYKKK